MSVSSFRRMRHERFVLRTRIIFLFLRKAKTWEATGGKECFMQKIFVFKRIRIDYVAADDVEEFLQLACIAVVHGSAIDDVGARLVVLRIIF